MLHIQTILHPTDFSEAAMQSLDLAHSLARDHKAKLVILAVAPLILPAPEVYIVEDPMHEMIEKERQRVADLAATITDVPVEHQARMGAPGAVITFVAEQVHADLIVMGTHGRTGVSRILMGSIAEYVMRHAPCPVLTVKPVKSEHIPLDESVSEVPELNEPAVL